jgi:hypothetical protein
MKQLYATGPLPAGADRDARSAAPTVRAATAGLAEADLQAALALARYAPPPAGDPDRPLPVRLALFHTGAGRVLAHVVPNGGRYFAHAQLAIQTWGSPLWQTHDPDSAADLPELPYLPVADVLDDAALRDWLATPARRDLLEFALTALLGTPPTTRVFVAAPADDVAKVVYAVTRALPSGLLDDFTFSTYEPDPLACPARLVGHDTGAADWELPAACYEGGGVAFNPGTGKRSDLPADVPFASYAVKALAAGDFATLDEVKATWQRLGLKDPRQFDLVYRMARGTGVLSKEEAAEALGHPPLAAWISARADALKQFLEWALDDRAFATTSFTRAVQTLRQKPEVLAKLALAVREHGLAALKAGDRNRTANALEVVLPMVAPGKANAVWGELLGHLADPDQLAWDVRWYLLPRFARFKQQGGATGVDPSLGKWLDVPAEKLGELLALDLPKGYHAAAARAALRRPGEPSAVLARTLANHPTLALTLLQPADDKDADRPVPLLGLLLAEAGDRPWFEDLLGRSADYPPKLLNRFFEATLAAGKVDADHVIRTQGDRLLTLFAGQTGLDRIGSQLLADPPADLLRNTALLDTLLRLKDDPAASVGLKERVAAVQSVRGYLDAPNFDPEAMRPVAAALQLTPPVLPPGTKGEVFAAVSEELAERADRDTLQADLEAALVEFGPVLANDPADLYENLFRDLRTRTDVFRHPTLLSTFLGLALGSARSPELAGKLEGLDVQAFAVATESAKRGGNRLLNDLDRRTADWPKPARTQWGFLLAAVRPRGLKGAVRDVLFFAAGAAIASAVWFAVAQFVR